MIKLESLNPWGEAVKVFSESHRNNTMAWIEEGINTQHLLSWNRVYPQLKWTKQGPLTQK